MQILSPGFLKKLTFLCKDNGLVNNVHRLTPHISTQRVIFCNNPHKSTKNRHTQICMPIFCIFRQRALPKHLLLRSEAIRLRRIAGVTEQRRIIHHGVHSAEIHHLQFRANILLFHNSSSLFNDLTIHAINVITTDDIYLVIN